MSIEPRKAIPIIGMVSAGKSTFLNSLLGTYVLEAKDDITTKFVCIIRHNPKLNEPIFYHVNLSKNANSDDYIYIKDGNETIGAEKIKEKISKINSDEFSLEPNYENLFYILELKITNIENNEFLKKYDFYDMPGLNENITESNKEVSIKSEENQKNANFKKRGKTIHQNQIIMEQEMKYISKLFPFFKTKVEFGIIIIDSENYYYPSNINIIKNIYNVFSKQITNYMFILNKIDKSENPNETVQKCKAFFTNNIDSSIFRISDNFFQPINSKQFNNEMLMKSNYENYYLYFFNEYCKYLNSNKDSQSISFSDFLFGKITEDKHTEDEKNEKIETLAKNVGDSQFLKIKEIYEKIKKETNMNINYGFDFEDEESQNILKSFYQVFLEKSLIPPYSENVKNILYFFNNFNMETIQPRQEENEQLNSNDNFLIKLRRQEKIINNFITVFHELKKYKDKDSKKNIIDTLEKDLEILKIMVKNQRKIYIPLIGVSSSGKSTILNNIVGYKMFPESKEECTTRGIIIQHSFDGISKLYETSIDCLLKNDNNYYIFKKNSKISPIIGRDKIISYLESINDEYTTDEKKQFFILKTPIAFFNENNLDDELKRRISFIDLPGQNSLKNIFNIKQGNLTTYEKLLTVCTSFLFVNKGTPLKIIENEQILLSTYCSIHRNSKLKNKNDFLKNCFFVMNMFNILKEEEKNIENVKNGISDIIFGKKELSKSINAVFFNAKQYSEFLRYKKNYTNINNVFKDLKEEYNKQFSFLYSYNIKKERNFPRYCLKTLNKELENLSLKIEPNFKCGEEFKTSIVNKIKEIMAQISQPFKANDANTVEKIANILYYIQKNIKKISFYKNSYCEDFFNLLMEQIYNSDAYTTKEFYEYMFNIMERFDSFFRIPPDKRNTKAQNEFSDLSKKITLDLINLFEKYKFTEIFEETKKNIGKFLNDKMIEAKKILKENKKDINKSFLVILEDLMKENINTLSSNLKEQLVKLSTEFGELKNDAYNNGKKINTRNNIENSSFLDDLKRIDFSYSVKKHLGIKNFVEIDSNELIDEIIVVHGFFNLISNFFKYLFKGKDEQLKDSILELKNKILEIINMGQKTFINNYENMQREINNEFLQALLTQSSDLSRISKEDYENALNLFVETKLILFDDRDENLEDLELKKTGEKKDNIQEKKDNIQRKKDNIQEKKNNIQENKNNMVEKKDNIQKKNILMETKINSNDLNIDKKVNIRDFHFEMRKEEADETLKLIIGLGKIFATILGVVFGAMYYFLYEILD